MIVKTTTKPTVTAPAFVGALAIFNTEAKLSKALSAAADAVQVTMQSYVDACLGAGLPKTEDGCKAIGKAIVGAMAEVIRENLPSTAGVSKKDAANMDLPALWTLSPIPKKTITEYAQGAQRAFFHGVPWSPRLKNDPDKGLPWGKAKGSAGSAGTAGKVESTDRAALDATLSKALRQARMLGLGGFAADMEALCADCLDGFKLSTEE
jgi:hypothetical protein